jgi:hypothetical protein
MGLLFAGAFWRRSLWRRREKKEQSIKRRRVLKEAKEREWKSIVCPEGKCKTVVMCEWDVVSTGGRIFKRTLRQIDCRNPSLAEFGGEDCRWGCEGILGKRER